MTFGEKIKALLQEAELYRGQGLLNEALEKFKSIEKFIQKAPKLKNRDKILSKIAVKKKAISAEIKNFRKPKKAPRVSDKARELMKGMFEAGDPKTKGSAALGGAISLKGFGQYDKAIKEFTTLLAFDPFRLDAAGHILDCLMDDSGPDAAISRFKEWLSDTAFTSGELDKIRSRLQALLDKAGVKKDVSGLQAGPLPEPDSEVDEDDILDINSIRFKLAKGAQKGEEIELDVNYQSGCVLNVIVSKKEKGVIEGIKTGDMMNDIVFYSPVAIFSGTGYVSDMTGIKSGPKKGDYSLSVKIIRILTG
ncbi:MAG: hypothetical protein GXP53_01700 [Deltaproteobacteria bacterium]|nr:hypothetical protein [Deltaproteobacteria bacterium]